MGKIMNWHVNYHIMGKTGYIINENKICFSCPLTDSPFMNKSFPSFPWNSPKKAHPSLHLLLFLMYSPRTAQLYFPLCLPSFSSAWDSLPFVSPLLDDAENNNRICWGSVRCWLNASNLGSEQESRASAYVLLFPVDSVDYQLVLFFSVVWIKTKTDSVPFSKAGGSFGRAVCL
jgi:hypothetical protein